MVEERVLRMEGLVSRAGALSWHSLEAGKWGKKGHCRLKQPSVLG